MATVTYEEFFRNNKENYDKEHFEKQELIIQCLIDNGIDSDTAKGLAIGLTNNTSETGENLPKEDPKTTIEKTIKALTRVLKHI